MNFCPYLFFRGQCKEALEFYAKLFGGEIIVLSTFAEAPAEEGMPAEVGDQVMHAQLKVGNQIFMASDDCQQYQQPQGFRITVGVETPEEAERIFHALSAGGSVTTPLEETFWAQRFAMFTDRFGIPWMVNCDKPEQ